jgi:hypothetical protein
LTPADEAELDVLLWEFVGGVFDHRYRCSVCRQGGPWCPALEKALAIVVNFQRGLLLRSKARWLRAEQELAEFAEQLGVAGGRAA